MKSLFAHLSILAIAAAVVAPAAGAAELTPQTKLNERFEQERIETLNQLTDRFDVSRNQVLNKGLNDRFKDERIQTLNSLSDRFDDERIETLNQLTDRFDNARDQNLDS
ncbi:MAG: hypothetical protein ACTS2F_30940 [Thainema sp.]